MVDFRSRFFELHASEDLSANDVAGAMGETAGAWAVVVDGGRPTAILSLTEMSGESRPIADLVEAAPSMTPYTLVLDLESGPTEITAYVQDDLAVLPVDTGHIVIPLGSDDLRDVLSRRNFQMFMADSETTGDPQPPPDPDVTLICITNGHQFTQPQSSQNRTCWCGGPLR